MGLLLAALAACVDPPDPPPAPGPPDLPRWSTAPHVRWAGPSTPVRAPLLLVVDQPGGPLDRLVADDDVATFLNDRYTPLFLVPEALPEAPTPSVQVIDAQGCWLLPPTLPADPAALIALGNAVMQDLHAGRPPAPRPTPPQPSVGTWPPDHPLTRACPPPRGAPAAGG